MRWAIKTLLHSGLTGWFFLSFAAAAEPLDAGMVIREAHYAILPEEIGLGDVQAAWAAGRFQPVPPSGRLPVTLGGEHLWTRLVWDNPGARVRQVVLEIIDFLEDHTALYFENEAGDWEQHLAGENVPFAEKSLWGREPAFFINIPPREDWVVWINNASDESQWPLYRLHDPADNFLRLRRGHDKWTGFYYGGLLALACYNLFVYSVLRRKEILYFLIYVMTFGLGFFLYQGLQFEWIPWLQSPFHNLIMASVMCLSVVALTQFSRKFLVVADYVPWLDRWLRVFMLIMTGSTGVLLGYAVVLGVDRRLWTDWPGFYHGIFPVLTITIMVGYVVLALAGVFLLRRGCRQARFFLLGFGAIFLFLVPAMLSQVQGRPVLSDIVWVQIGSGLEMFFFAFALVDKIRIMRDEKDAAVEKAEHESAERTRLERAHAEIVRQKLLLEEMHQQKSEFLGIAAHDLKNPLNAIQAIAWLLEEDERRPGQARMPAGERVGFITDVADSAERMLAIIDTLLEAETLDSGRIELNLKGHPLGSLVEAAWRGLSSTAKAKGMVADISVPDGLLVLVDEARFRRVLENLLSNAIKYSPAGGSIRLEAAPDFVPGRVMITIGDSGPGFSEQDIPRIFGRYRKLSARPTGGESSTGLGLYIVKRLLELQGGSIRLASPPGQSAIFRIDIPAA